MLEQPSPTSNLDLNGAETTIDDTPHAIPFDDVQDAELKRIEEARQGRLPGTPPEKFRRDMRLVGLALSGGGVRSATFSLGVLQALARVGLLRHLDLLSSTGGGAELAGWFLRWIHARGFTVVEEQLGGKDSPRSEAPEIQALRRAIALTKRGSRSITILASLANVLLNLFALGTLLASALLLTRIGLEKLSSLHFIPDAYPVLILATAFLLVLPQIKKSPTCSPSQLRTVFIAVVLSVFAALLVHGRMSAQTDFSSEWRMLTAFATALFCLILGLELQRPFSGRKELALTGAAVLIGIMSIGLIDGFLRFLLPVLIPPALTYAPAGFPYNLRLYEWPTYVSLAQFAVAAVILLMAGSFALFALLIRKWVFRGTRELFWRTCRTLVAFSVVLFTAAFAWTIPIWATIAGIVVAGALTFLGLPNKAVGKSSIRTSLKEVLEHVAPGTFLIAFAGFFAALLMPLTEQYTWVNPTLQMAATLSLAVISVVLLWLIRARELTAHRVHRAEIIRDYLTISNSAAADTDASDVNLSSFAEPQAYGPYPLFNSAIYLTEIGADPSVPFLFSPIVSGFELPAIRDSKRGVSAYRPTGKLGGGISLATAIAISQPIHGRSFRPPSGPTSLLWTIFNMRDGRFVGNPIDDDMWRNKGPLIEPLYALREGDLATEMPFVRPSPSEAFDYLGIYQLVKRRCHFIIACDATNDPDFAFEELGKTIRRCRTDLGVEIQMDLGPLGRTPAKAGAHFQIAQIKYDGEDGFMVYIKPSVTGDEPTELVQYGRTHPDFPATAVTGGRFDESDFESYRRLGQHIVERFLQRFRYRPTCPPSRS